LYRRLDGFQEAILAETRLWAFAYQFQGFRLANFPAVPYFHRQQVGLADLLKGEDPVGKA